MKVLILTCNTGQGHNSSAVAIQEVFVANGVECDIADTLAFLSKGASKVVDTCFTGIYRHIPKAFDVGYANTDRKVGKFDPGNYIKQVLRPGKHRLRLLVEKNGYTHILCVHPFSAMIVAMMQKKHHLPITSSFLTTDYAAYPVLDKTDVDMYFLPHADLADSFAAVGIDREKMIPTGIPVRPAFFEEIDRADARQALDLPADSPVLFLMGGSMGCGPIEDLVFAVSGAMPEEAILMVSCGTNDKLLRTLQKQENHHIRPFRYADNVPQIMAAADLFITKPGGISITEAGVAGLPMLLINFVGGCETANFEFFTERDYAFAAKDVTDAAQKCREVLSDPSLLQARSALLRDVFRKNSVEEICRAVMERQ